MVLRVHAAAWRQAAPTGSWPLIYAVTVALPPKSASSGQVRGGLLPSRRLRAGRLVTWVLEGQGGSSHRTHPGQSTRGIALVSPSPHHCQGPCSTVDPMRRPDRPQLPCGLRPGCCGGRELLPRPSTPHGPPGRPWWPEEKCTEGRGQVTSSPGPLETDRRALRSPSPAGPG